LPVLAETLKTTEHNCQPKAQNQTEVKKAKIKLSSQ